ncbi:MAG TPA: PadR family transcriptional regulator [Candidatus Angelobacter sp.]|jgi:DNA-binding PadR family transcriptional regulator|nr:PadR family transcriptional regulator [Candidatus Angelobacter sp.]
MKPSTIPVLGYALLGLLHQKAQSGYDLRKIFAETAMGNYGSSPGAIYPALQRLERGKLIAGQVVDGSGMRRRCVYRLTDRGLAELKLWLERPIAAGDVRRGAAELMLRFSFMEKALGVDACIAFLRSFGGALKPYVAELEGFLAANSAVMPLAGRLAVENGIRGYRSMHGWTQYALRAFVRLRATNRKRKPSTSKGGRK